MRRQRLGATGDQRRGTELGHEPGPGPRPCYTVLLTPSLPAPPASILGPLPPRAPANTGGPQPCTLLGHCSTGDILGLCSCPPPDGMCPIPRPHSPTYTSPTEPHPNLGLAEGKEEEEATAWESHMRPQGLENKDAPEGWGQAGMKGPPFPQWGGFAGHTGWLMLPLGGRGGGQDHSVSKAPLQ